MARKSREATDTPEPVENRPLFRVTCAWDAADTTSEQPFHRLGSRIEELRALDRNAAAAEAKERVWQYVYDSLRAAGCGEGLSVSVTVIDSSPLAD